MDITIRLTEEDNRDEPFGYLSYDARVVRVQDPFEGWQDCLGVEVQDGEDEFETLRGLAEKLDARVDSDRKMSTKERWDKWEKACLDWKHIALAVPERVAA